MVKLIELLANKQRMRILEFLSTRPTGEFSQTDLISKLRIAKPTAIKNLNHLEKNQLVLTKRIGRTKLYKLNLRNFLVIQIKRLFNLTSHILAEFAEKVEARKIIVFGSYARGEDTEASDIDVLVVTDLKDEAVQKVARLISEKYGRRLAVITRTPEQYVRMAEEEKELWERAVLQGVKICEA
jgi:predicted nucleotidyltransferase